MASILRRDVDIAPYDYTPDFYTGVRGDSQGGAIKIPSLRVPTATNDTARAAPCTPLSVFLVAFLHGVLNTVFERPYSSKTQQSKARPARTKVSGFHSQK